MVHSKTLTSIILGLLCLNAPSRAQNNTATALVGLCTAAISSPSNSVTSYERQQWARTATAGMCQIGFSNVSSFTSAAGGLNLSLPVAGALFGLGASGNWSNSDVQQAYQKICQNHEVVDIGANVSFLQSATVSDAMAGAYQFCVDKLPDIARSLSPSGLVIRVTLSGDNTFNIFSKSFAAAPIAKITDITGVTTCSIEGQSFAIGQPINFEPPRIEFIGTCQRASPSDQSVAVSTNEGVSNVIAIPAVVSAQQITDKRLRQIENRVQMLTNQYADTGLKIEDIKSQIANKIEDIKSQIAKMSQNLLKWGPPETPEAFNSGAHTCSDGFYLAGVIAGHTPSGIDTLQFICHKLNPSTN